MTRDEVKQILAVIDATYPNFKAENLTELVNAWHFMLSEYDYNKIAIGLKTYVTTSGSAFAPSVSELIAVAYKPQEMAYINESEAWDMVYKALCNSNYNADAEFNKLPEIVQKAVGSASQLRAWASDSHFNAGVESSNFKRVYKTMIDRHNEMERMPIEMRTQINNLLEAKYE